MKIGVIGTGNIGKVIIQILRKANHDVKIANEKDPKFLKEFANEIGAEAVTVENVVKDVDVVFLVLQTKNIPELPKGLFENVKTGTVVVDVSNYYPYRDGQIEEIESGMIESEWVSKQINFPVVKSFNTMLSHSLFLNGRSIESKDRLALAISGDDSNAKKTVAEIINSVGYDPVDIGSISESWRQQGGSPIYCTDLTKEELLHWYPKTKREVLPERRDKITELYFKWSEDVILAEQIKDLRTVFCSNLE
jgi:8-hydroxy-5-deazaflavin:NADPH oxidoreductase